VPEITETGSGSDPIHIYRRRRSRIVSTMQSQNSHDCARVNPKELPIFQQLPRFQKGPGRIAKNSTYRTGELFYLFGNCSAAAKDRKDAIQICVQPFAKKEF
jgi:hypothetical protein